MIKARANRAIGWHQVSHGNLGWPGEFGLNSDINNPRDTWKFAAIQAIPWFTAAILGLIVLDPASEYLGRYVFILLCLHASDLKAVASQFLTLSYNYGFVPF